MERESLEEIASRLRKFFSGGKTKSPVWRKEQLQSILKLILENEHEICLALKADLGKHYIEAYRDEVALVGKSVRLALQSLKKWMAPTKVSVPLVAFPCSTAVVAEPLGVILIFSSWNFPFMLSMDPLIGAIAAGNAVVVKPSEIAPATSSLIAKLVPRYLDSSAVSVVEGGIVESTKLLEQKWDKIFFTGSPHVGKIIMSAAAKYLTPVTLELGGKCPTIVDSKLDPRALEVTARRIVVGKWGTNNGQACLSPDYVLVEEKFASTLVRVLKETIESFFGEDASKSNDLSKIVNDNHFLRLRKLLQEPGIASTVVYGGKYDEKRMYIQPTILLDPTLDSAIMTDEIFGPLLPVITLKRIEDCIDFINSRPKALAIYVFTKDKTLQERIISETSSGSLAVNDTIVQFALDALPFGGVGESGFGRYHGKFSFDTFSNRKAVLVRSFILDTVSRYPPWNSFKLSFIRALLHFDYLGMLLVWLGLKK